MSLESKEKTSSLPPVDPQVINSALNELHLDDDDLDTTDTNPTTVSNTNSGRNHANNNGPRSDVGIIKSTNANISSDVANGISQSPPFNPLPQNGLHMFPPPHHHQVMGMNFVPYSQMMPMPPPHGFPGVNSPNNVGDPLWQDTGLAQNPAAADVAATDDTEKNVSSFRRQTFHAISQNDLIAISGTTENITATGNPEEIQTRTQSISLDNEFAATTAAQAVAGTTGTVETVEGQDTKNGQPNSSNPFPAAAYPYGGPLMQPNSVISGHHTPIPSPFPGAYGFTSPFQSFSPIVHPHSPIPMHHHQMQFPQNPHQLNDPSVEPKATNDENDDKLVSKQNSSTPPPWMYGNPPFGHMVPHPHGVHHPHHLMNRNNKFHNGNKNSYGRNKNGNRNGYNGYHQRKMEDSLIYSNATLDQFIGEIYSLCKDQHGCRFLQKQLDVMGENAANAIFNETKEHTVELMTDSFGNYLIQKLLERVTVEQRLEIAQISAPYFVDIALNPHGTRALQKLVECVGTEEEAQLVVDSLQPSIVELSKDLNGNHVVQKCLQKLDPTYFQFIFDAASQDCVDIATQRHGCCVLQRCLDHGNKDQRRGLCEMLLSNIDQLSIDPFGNYVVQYVITKESEEKAFDYSYKIVEVLKPKVKDLSLHKFGSNVVEKILKTPALSEPLILELLKNNDESEIQMLLNDSYGNYVLQTALDVSHSTNPSLYKRLSDIVSPLLVGPIRNTPHGRRIINKLNMT
ncbi:hypothetical protein Kpol_1061p41 [Vanderwaltozyma polyspora DSM 70294]|uniref:PUM-HD domain-containing protein n=1 Tax=Vanderwaltozyma polyspora (strain ATCC 22028 / DSM 70294 / BCRC 21397 / CBS 2163 / NBRC 10782 / NRRL Y-8283 / UCD 57-17) TaxID=436907 RepID=A7TJG6_VANPO|nr:uncharacterized protein Kpol_1061p41 [Vanderwaltozyma polyspora DSM 70294]EDO17616.1 hypothetical protein Kpol_1061p41 [Vanderwaltozyma polyspora DSM 70294]